MMPPPVSTRRTPLFDTHRQLGGRLIEFGGWEMPVQYSSIVEEHLAVRNAAGIFDISHMGEVRLRGPAALAFLNQTLTNNAAKLEVGHGQYTLMCRDDGGVVDDLYAFRVAPEEYWLVINASRIADDTAWLARQRELFTGGQVTVEDLSPTWGGVAVQGPRVADFINHCFDGPAKGGLPVAAPADLRKNQISAFNLAGGMAWVSRTGYTGEDGFEVLAPGPAMVAVWNRVCEAGRGFGLKPAGLGARDTLRTEACYPLYGHELDLDTTPLEAGLGYFVALDKPEFRGRARLAAQKVDGLPKRCVAFKMTGAPSPPPRPQYRVRGGPGAPVGEGVVTSGTQSPSLGVGIGMAYVPPALAAPGTPLAIEIRGQSHPAVVAARPLYRRPA